MAQQDILCDSSSLISLTDSCLDSVFPYLSNKFRMRFIIPPSVEYECVEKPLGANLRQYIFSAIKIKKMIVDGTLVKVAPGQQNMTNSILLAANNLLYSKGRPLNLVHRGESEMIGLAIEAGVKNLLIDERTTRMIVEAPFRMKEHMEKEFGISIMLNNENLRKLSDMTKGMQSIRSSELLILAYENGFFDKFGNMKTAALEAALYKLKFSGCSIRFDEVEDYMKSLSSK